MTEEDKRPLLPPDYVPSEDEEFMNPVMQEYFRQKLLHMKQEILVDSKETLEELQQETLYQPDPTDRASIESDLARELRLSDRKRKLTQKIDEALERIDSGEYGYCAVSGNPIRISRLEARPTTTLSLVEQERHEKREKTKLGPGDDGGDLF